jgi:hypothetical protein
MKNPKLMGPNIYGPVSRQRFDEAYPLFKKIGLPLNEFVAHIEAHPTKYPSWMPRIKACEDNVEKLIRAEKRRACGQMMNAIKERLKQDHVLGRTFRLFESVRVDGHWVRMLKRFAAKDDQLRSQVLGRNETGVKVALARRIAYVDYVAIVAGIKPKKGKKS